jgi:hypothetical protein
MDKMKTTQGISPPINSRPRSRGGRVVVSRASLVEDDVICTTQSGDIYIYYIICSLYNIIILYMKCI